MLEKKTVKSTSILHDYYEILYKSFFLWKEKNWFNRIISASILFPTFYIPPHFFMSVILTKIMAKFVDLIYVIIFYKLILNVIFKAVKNLKKLSEHITSRRLHVITKPHCLSPRLLWIYSKCVFCVWKVLYGWGEAHSSYKSL